MPLVIEHTETKEKFLKATDEAVSHDTRVKRRVYCTGCGTGNTYTPEQWTYGKEQVASWFEEHKDHKA